MISPRKRLIRIRLGLIWRPTLSPRQIVATAVALILGFGGVAAWRASHTDQALATARPDQLLALLDSLSSRQQRLVSEQQELAVTKEKLLSGSNAAALTEAKQRLTVLQILSGTKPARGPGISLVMQDPDLLVPSSLILDTVQELRDAGAEAIQIADIRVVANTWFADVPSGGIRVSGRVLKPPYTITAIGDSATMKTALGIPGGIQDAVKAAGGSVRASVGRNISVSAVVSATR
jgi:uncharacterized protein YlxW (UPF0749 family)